MSREASRVRALESSARLRQLLEARDRVELFGYALARPEPVADRDPGTATMNARREAVLERTALHLDA